MGSTRSSPALRALRLRALHLRTSYLQNPSVGIAANPTEITTPSQKDQYIKLSSDGSKFRAIVTHSARRITVKVIGAYADNATGGADRAAVQLSYDTQEIPTNFFSNGLASKSSVIVDTKIPVQGSPPSHANILSISPATPPVTIGSSSSLSSIAG